MNKGGCTGTTAQRAIVMLMFYLERVRSSVVFVGRWENDESKRFYDDTYTRIDIPDFQLPDNYDLLINPFFFVGENYMGEVAQDSICSVTRGSKIFRPTLAPATGKGLLLLFGQDWQDFVRAVCQKCKRGRKSLNGMVEVSGEDPFDDWTSTGLF